MTFQNKLLKWYGENKRRLPWRETSDPYHIWLSEIMLQQTQVATVIDYYLEFISYYDSFESLSQGKEEHILKLWEGLGYYSRARRLIPCAQRIMNDFDGQFPRDYKDALSLPGIGPYTAGAILSIAFNQKIPAVDGNVKRVYSRLQGLRINMSSHKAKKQMTAIVEKTLPDNCRDFNQGLMELGALICTPRNPKCSGCPIQDHCVAYKENLQDELPIKNKKKKKKDVHLFVLKLHVGDEFLLIKRKKTGLLPSLWGFLTLEKNEDISEETQIKDFLLESFHLKVNTITKIKSKKHIFTHLNWHMDLMKVDVENKITIPKGQWITRDELEHFAIPSAFKKLL